MLQELPIEDLHFYRHLYSVQPFGYRRDEFNTGLIASSIYNSQRSSKEAKVWTPLDMMPLTRLLEAKILEQDEERYNEHNRQALRHLWQAHQRKQV